MKVTPHAVFRGEGQSLRDTEAGEGQRWTPGACHRQTWPVRKPESLSREDFGAESWTLYSIHQVVRDLMKKVPGKGSRRCKGQEAPKHVVLLGAK